MSGSYTDPFAQASQSLGYGQPNTPLPTAQMPLPQSTGGLPSDQPGMFGVAPSTWQNIAAMGAGMIQGANQRTADGHLVSGTGIAGGLAGAAQGLIGNQMAQARARSEYGLQGEQMQGLHLQNQINQAMLPYQLQRAKLSAALMDPNVAAQYWRQMDAASGMPGGGGSAPIDFGNGDYASAVNGRLEGGPGQNPRSSANGYGQLIQEQKLAFAKANPQYFQGATSLDGPFQNPDVGKAATNWMAQQNAPVLSSAGVPVSGPTLAMAHRLGPAPAAAVFKAPDQTPLPVALAQALPPEKVADYVRANPDFAKQTVGQFKQQFAGVPNYGPAQNVQYQPGQGGAQPGSAPGQGGAGGFASPGVSMQAQQRAADLTAQAGRLEQRQAQAKMLGIPGPPGDAAAMRAQASEYLKLGLAGPSAAQTEAGTQGVRAQTEPALQGAIADAKNASEMAYAPRIAMLKAISEGQVKPYFDRAGNIYVNDAQGNVIHIGTGADVKEIWNPKTQTYDWGRVGGTGVGSVLRQQGNGQIIPGGMDDTGTPAKPGPLSQEFMHERGEKLGGLFNEVDEAAAAAKDSNYLFDNMRADAKTWDMGKFAPIEADARAWLSATAQAFNIKGPAVDSLNQKLADFQAFNKSSGQLLRSAVHDTSSRAAVQEYKLIGDSLPQPTTSPQAFGQVADQWQGMNDFRLAKQKFMQSYQGTPERFSVEFNSRVSPTAFMLNRMSQSPEGQQTMTQMLHTMQQSAEGRLQAARMLANFKYAKTNGLFDDLPQPGQDMPPPGQQ